MFYELQKTQEYKPQGEKLVVKRTRQSLLNKPDSADSEHGGAGDNDVAKRGALCAARSESRPGSRFGVDSTAPDRMAVWIRGRCRSQRERSRERLQSVDLGEMLSLPLVLGSVVFLQGSTSHHG